MTEQDRSRTEVANWLRPADILASSRRSWIPATFVLFSLLALLLAPILLGHRTERIRERVVEPAQAARGEINDVRHAFSRAEAAVRGLLLTGEERFFLRLQEAQAEEREAFARLSPLSIRLDPDLARRVAELRARSDRAARDRAALLRSLQAGDIPDRLLRDEEARHDRLLGGADEVKGRIVAMIDDARATIRATERAHTLLTVALTLLALVSGGVVLWIGQGYRRRAVEEAELRSAALALAEATEVGEVLRRIAAIAARTERGEHGYVERIDEEAGDVEVVASAGTGAPPAGTRMPYPGSLTAEALRSRDPEVVRGIGQLDRPIARVLAASCSRCVALIVPLVADHDARGALVILRDEGSTFSEGEISQRRALGSLAALAIRKTMLIERARQQHAALRQVVESRERLVRGFSHDVKNPLGAADGHAQLLAEGILGEMTPRQQESVGRIRSSIRSALEIITAQVDLARSEAGQLPVRTAELDASRVVRETGEIYRAVAGAADLELVVDPGTDIPTVRSDPQRVHQVLGNLISNAIKYTPRGGTVRLAARPRNGRRAGDPSRWVTLEVSDTGPGIPEEEQDRLFTEFRRLQPDAAEGAGLGLAISDRVARLLGGEITLDSTPGEGATFTLWLPADTD